jgi:hypothetical protein
MSKKTPDTRFVRLFRNKSVFRFKVPFTDFTIVILKRVLTKTGQALLAKSYQTGEVGEIYGMKFFESSAVSKDRVVIRNQNE